MESQSRSQRRRKSRRGSRNSSRNSSANRKNSCGDEASQSRQSLPRDDVSGSQNPTAWRQENTQNVSWKQECRGQTPQRNVQSDQPELLERNNDGSIPNLKKDLKNDTDFKLALENIQKNEPESITSQKIPLDNGPHVSSGNHQKSVRSSSANKKPSIVSCDQCETNNCDGTVKRSCSGTRNPTDINGSPARTNSIPWRRSSQPREIVKPNENERKLSNAESTGTNPELPPKPDNRQRKLSNAGLDSRRQNANNRNSSSKNRNRKYSDEGIKQERQLSTNLNEQRKLSDSGISKRDRFKPTQSNSNRSSSDRETSSEVNKPSCTRKISDNTVKCVHYADIVSLPLDSNKNLSSENEVSTPSNLETSVESTNTSTDKKNEHVLYRKKENVVCPVLHHEVSNDPSICANVVKSSSNNNKLVNLTVLKEVVNDSSRAIDNNVNSFIKVDNNSSSSESRTEKSSECENSKSVVKNINSSDHLIDKISNSLKQNLPHLTCGIIEQVGGGKIVPAVNKSTTLSIEDSIPENKILQVTDDRNNKTVPFKKSYNSVHHQNLETMPAELSLTFDEGNNPTTNSDDDNLDDPVEEILNLKRKIRELQTELNKKIIDNSDDGDILINGSSDKTLVGRKDLSNAFDNKSQINSCVNVSQDFIDVGSNKSETEDPSELCAVVNNFFDSDNLKMEGQRPLSDSSWQSGKFWHILFAPLIRWAFSC